ncbi:MAG: hypothetical protein IKB98_04785 [Clostridia bacterium]|nr:hypothetical protein [Clostridia bacterium]
MLEFGELRQCVGELENRKKASLLLLHSKKVLKTSQVRQDRQDFSLSQQNCKLAN